MLGSSSARASIELEPEPAGSLELGSFTTLATVTSAAARQLGPLGRQHAGAVDMWCRLDLPQKICVHGRASGSAYVNDCNGEEGSNGND
ncbi:hypothetical protein ACP4OV_030163 [Aristida adscensionis]